MPFLDANRIFLQSLVIFLTEIKKSRKRTKERKGCLKRKKIGEVLFYLDCLREGMIVQ
jgi:hypothetical protein